MTNSNYRFFTVAMLIAVVGGVGLWSSQLGKPSLVQQVVEAYGADDFEEVESLLAEIESDGELSDDLLWYGGLASQAAGRHDEAVARLRTLLAQTADDKMRRKAGLKLAAIHEDRQLLNAASKAVLGLINSYPSDVGLRRKAASLLDSAGRRFEGNVQHFELLKLNRPTTDDLILLADRHEPFVNGQIEAAIKENDANAFRVTRALIAWRSGRLSDAEDLLRQEIEAEPGQLEPMGLLGLVLVDQGQFDALPSWHAGLPNSAETHPDVWYVRGVWAEELGRRTDAATCFRKAVQLDSGYREALFRLSKLSTLLTNEQLKSIVQTTQQLEEYRQICKSIFFDGPQLTAVTRAIDLTESLGRIEEAIGWCKVLNVEHRAIRSQDRIKKLRQQLVEGSDKQLPDWLTITESSLPVAEFPKPGDLKGSVGAESRDVQFIASGTEIGLNFTYENGATGTSGLMIQQSMGGGVAVIDFDRDSWPDLFFPQGATSESSLGDGLFRNRRGEAFDYVAEKAECGDRVYSHGAAIGDINDDGFPDVYVANAGRNQLFINNGDGTFDMSPNLVSRETWSMCSVIADLNGDAFPDLFDVNYLEWGHPFELVCIDSEIQLPRTCPPERFKGACNDLQLNAGQGSFRNSTEEAGLSEIVGKSLGVIAADFDGSGNLGLFIANDQVANSFLMRESVSNGTPLFSNRAVSSGLAFDGLGDAYACMGIAAADIDHDGLLDMFVTNFYRQPNTLYMAIGAGGYRDATRSSGLREPGLLKLGFGAQFLDADLNGEVDLVVGNGHLDDFSHKNIPYEMEPQLFMNDGELQFTQYHNAGAFFAKPQLTRGMATLDWNRDGRPDFSVSNLASPAQLVTNVTQDHGHFIAIRLIGKQSSRDAIGAIVSVTTADGTQWRHRIAGDGYASSNECRLLFGLAGEQSVAKVVVTWPSGMTQEFGDLAGDSEYSLREASAVLYNVPR